MGSERRMADEHREWRRKTWQNEEEKLKDSQEKSMKYKRGNKDGQL